MLVLFCSKRALIWIASIIILVEPFIRVATYFLLPAFRTRISIMGHTRADLLMFGCLAALLYDSPRFQNALSVLYGLQVPVFSAVFLFVVSPILSNYAGGNYTFVIGYTLQGLAVVTRMLYSIQRADGVFGRLLNRPILVHIGLISYSLYLWQQPFLPRRYELKVSFLLFAIALAEGSY